MVVMMVGGSWVVIVSSLVAGWAVWWLYGC